MREGVHLQVLHFFIDGPQGSGDTHTVRNSSLMHLDAENFKDVRVPRSPAARPLNSHSAIEHLSIEGD